MTEIHFTIRSKNGEAAFRAKWIEAGILLDEPGYVFAPAYDVEITATQGWSGIITDAEGNAVPGWHGNAIARGHTAEAMTQGLAQTDAEGNLLPLMQRTWAAYVFGLVESPDIDTESGFPYAAVTSDDAGIQYGDPADLSTPANVRQ
jgi:hypothetical protein